MRTTKRRLLAGIAVFVPLRAGHAGAADRAILVQLAQATTGDTQPPLTEEEKKRRALELLKKRQKAGQQPNGAPADKLLLPSGKPLEGPDAKHAKPLAPLDSSVGGTSGEPKKTLPPGSQIDLAPMDKKILPAGKLPVLPEVKALKPIAPLDAAPTGAGNPANKNKALVLPGTITADPKAILKPVLAAPPVVPALAPAPKLDAIKKGRQEHVEDGGKRTIIEEPGNRTIVKQGDGIAIHHDESDRLRRIANTETKKRADGVTETVTARPDGARVVTETDGRGHLLRVYRHDRDGRDDSIIDNRQFFLAGAGLGLGLAIALELAPPVITIPRDRYIVDYRRASDDDLYETLDAPPLERLERAYSLEEIRYNEVLRERMRRIDLDSVNFRSGASDPDPSQYPKLERLARALARVLDRRPNEVFLVEGYTDAVGSQLDNLSLSDRRAEAVAQILAETFGVPPENLVTQGYGEQFLKIDTQAAERANRRVAVRRITPLMAQQ